MNTAPNSSLLSLQAITTSQLNKSQKFSVLRAVLFPWAVGQWPQLIPLATHHILRREAETSSPGEEATPRGEVQIQDLQKWSCESNPEVRSCGMEIAHQVQSLSHAPLGLSLLTTLSQETPGCPAGVAVLTCRST